MTSKLTITRERLSGIARGENCYTHDDVIELALAQLAAMDSEPVAWMHSNNDIGIPAITVSQKIGHYWMAEFENVQPLYRHAQPAPVSVPDAATAIRACMEEFPESVHDIVEECAAIAESACRAAQPQAVTLTNEGNIQAGNSPVIPDRWIPVSERMPEDRMAVILWDADIDEVTSGHYSHKTQLFYHCGEVIGNEITHWMPPPAAPQEDINALIPLVSRNEQEVK
ncbi:TPA: DUF551 domain-containing protein [Raoultella ornithinolytica]|nr:DUF551 domain-containing protein [Raoultella ornithinolytica]